MNKKVVVLGILAICLSISIGIGFSYAFWNQTEKQQEANAYQTGCFAISLTNQENAINLSNQFPITDNEGKQLVPFTFTVENTCDYYASYAINLEILEDSTLEDKYIKVMLDDNDPVRLDNDNLKEATRVEAKSLKSKTLATSGVDAHKSNNHSLRIWIDEDATTDAANKILNSKIVISAVATEKPPTGVEYLETLLTNNPTMIIQDDTVDKNIRFIGANPHNYVRFNDEDWRIIGVFNNMWECPDYTEDVTVTNYSGKCLKTKLLKIIRKDFIGSISWDSRFVNDWSKASLMTLLNSGAYWSRGGEYESIGLTTDAQQMIARTMWNLGGLRGGLEVLTKQYYTAERGTTVYSGRPTKWIGKVGLIYPSDYGYATGGGTIEGYDRNSCLESDLYFWDTGNYKIECTGNDWLWESSLIQWTITPRLDSGDNAFDVYTDGYVRYGNYVNYPRGVRPVVYLKSEVKIVHDDTHNGTSDHPYGLSF